MNMRCSSFAWIIAAAAAAMLVASIPADAQPDRARTRITVQKRSYLDAGTVVKPGTAKYHEYAFPVRSLYPSYGPFPDDQQRFRYPLPSPFDVPGF
jgi:hypothetical protein